LGVSVQNWASLCKIGRLCAKLGVSVQIGRLCVKLGVSTHNYMDL
jgi:hypothetical protein